MAWPSQAQVRLSLAGQVFANVAALTKLPPLRRRKGGSWTSEQAGMFFDSSRDGEDDLYACPTPILGRGS
ncbi:hypothetical protein ACLQ28_26390 [Micromonospora sp. DT201]